MLRGSCCSGYGDFSFHPSWADRSDHTAGVESRPNLFVSFQRNRVNPYRSFLREVSSSQEEPMAVRTAGQGESEGCSVMEQILVASAMSTTLPGAKASRLP
jgi:hypothetical protein